MKHERKFREHERDYEDSRRKKEKRNKGRHGDRGIGEIWADMFEGDELAYVDTPAAKHVDYQSKQNRQPTDPKAQASKPSGPAFQFNEAATIDVKGYKIDLSRVKSMSKTQTVHNNKDSFGIEFLFVGSKGLGRTIWYGTNFHQRDSEFDQYYATWLKVKP